MIEAVGLTKSFGGRVAVDDVSFAVEPGEVVGFLGPNGAGKTTTIRLLLGLLRPRKGHAVRPDRVGYLPEHVVPYEQLTASRYLRFLCALKGVARSEAGAEAARCLAAAGLADLPDRPAGRLSRGQRQRLGLAAALVGRPPAYLLDEPTTGLDPRQIVEARALVRSLAADEGAAVLMSTHLLAEASAMCDRVVVISEGRVLADRETGDIADLEPWFLDLVAEKARRR